MERESFQGHSLRLYLDKTFYKALIKLQADKGLGPSFAGLLIYTEGLHSLGYITDQEHEQHVKRYSEPLMDAPKLPTTTEVKEKAEISDWEKRFSRAIKEWASMNEKSRDYYVKKAKELGATVPNADLIIALAVSGPQ